MTENEIKPTYEQLRAEIKELRLEMERIRDVVRTTQEHVVVALSQVVSRAESALSKTAG